MVRGLNGIKNKKKVSQNNGTYKNPIAKLTRTLSLGDTWGIHLTYYIIFAAFLLLFIALVWLIITHPPKIIP
jgi:hypothetical protein